MLISKQYTFEAAHILPRHPGKCSRLHGHSWRLEVEVHGSIDTNSGFVLDFNTLDIYVEPIVERFDHSFLNVFVKYPSSEHVALHILNELRARMLGLTERIIVRVAETAKCWAVADTANSYDLTRLNFDALDAEWKSPDPGLQGGSDISAVFGNVKAKLPDLQKKYFDALIVLGQLHLYMHSMDDKPVLPFDTEDKPEAVPADDRAH